MMLKEYCIHQKNNHQSVKAGGILYQKDLFKQENMVPMDSPALTGA
jgi:hypothetical protein